jgi:plastocyanin
LAAALLVAVIAVACTGAAGPRGVELDAGDFSFQPPQLTVSAGQVTLSFANKGKVRHNLSVPSIPVDVDGEPGSKQSVIFVLPAGSEPVEFFCKYHRDRNMSGTFRVQ